MQSNILTISCTALHLNSPPARQSTSRVERVPPKESAGPDTRPESPDNR